MGTENRSQKHSPSSDDTMVVGTENRSQKHSPSSDDTMESSFSYETSRAKLPDCKRKRTREREGIQHPY